MSGVPGEVPPEGEVMAASDVEVDTVNPGLLLTVVSVLLLSFPFGDDDDESSVMVVVVTTRVPAVEDRLGITGGWSLLLILLKREDEVTAVSCPWRYWSCCWDDVVEESDGDPNTVKSFRWRNRACTVSCARDIMTRQVRQRSTQSSMIEHTSNSRLTDFRGKYGRNYGRGRTFLTHLYAHFYDVVSLK